MILNKLVNHLMKNGEKKVSEKIVLKSVKELQKGSKKKAKNLIQLALSYSIPVFKLYTVLNSKKKSWDKKAKGLAIFLWFKQARTSIIIKLIIANTRKIKGSNCYLKLKEEVLLILLQSQNSIIQIKNESQKQVLSYKHYFLYYRWS